MKNILFKIYIDNKTIIVFSDGSIFRGKTNNEDVCLNGAYLNINDDLYLGQFENNQYNGKGMIIHKSGSLYKGNFKDGYKEGHGIFIKHGNNFLIDCYWIKDKMDDSQIVKIITNDHFYKGTIKNINNDGVEKVDFLNGYIGHHDDYILKYEIKNGVNIGKYSNKSILKN